MSEFKVDKPIIFISHASTDKEIVGIIKSQIDKVFANSVEVFASSVLGVIKPGSDWLDEVNQNLSQAKVVIAVITPTSINRPWIWFELGASWSKMGQGQGKIYPLYVPEINPTELPEPLSRLQALSLGKADHVKLLFEDLCELFGIGNMKGFKGTSITKRIPKYDDIKINPADLKTGQIYDGPFEGYGDEEFYEILFDYVSSQIKEGVNNFNLDTKFNDFGSNTDTFHDLLSYLNSHIAPDILSGNLIHFREIDKKLQLPFGTSSRLLKNVVLEPTFQIELSRKMMNSSANVKFEVDKEFDNSIRFHIVST